MRWKIHSDYLYGTTKKFSFKDKIAMFDLDNTLITTKDGRTFPIDENDWKWRFSNVPSKLKSLFDNEYCIIIISNQACIAVGKQTVEKWTGKLDLIEIELAKLGIEFRAFCSVDQNKYRKPIPSFYDEFIPKFVETSDGKIDGNIDLQNNTKDLKSLSRRFYCGDAAGRKGDFTDTDLKFALNCNVLFYTPENMFQNKPNIYPLIKYPNIFTVPSYFAEKSKSINFKPKSKKQMLIFTGFPASGKSHLAKFLEESHNYKIINQDTLKTKLKCLKETAKLLKQSHSIIIDMTNPDIESRKNWIDLAIPHKYEILSVHINTSENHSKHNNIYRELYCNSKRVPLLVYNIYKKKFQKPELSEGFDKLVEYTPISPRNLEYYNFLF